LPAERRRTATPGHPAIAAGRTAVSRDLGNELKVSFVERVRFSPDAKARNIFVNVRNAVFLGFGLFDGFSGLMTNSLARTG
jgi:hypothetical protein